MEAEQQLKSWPQANGFYFGGWVRGGIDCRRSRWEGDLGKVILGQVVTLSRVKELEATEEENTG